MLKINLYISTGILILMGAIQCQKTDSDATEISMAATRCGGSALSLHNSLNYSQNRLDSIAIHLKKLPTGQLKKKVKLAYQRNLRWKFSIQKSADSLAASQLNCADWKTIKVHQKATGILHALLEINNDIEDYEDTIAVALKKNNQ